MKTREDLVTQALALVASGNRTLDTQSASTHSSPVVKEELFHEFRIGSLSYLSRVFGANSTYYQSFKSEVTHATASRTRRGVGILSAARKELEGNWLETTRGAISKDILTSILKLARTHFDQGCLHAAVILAGGVINELLQQLCLAQNIRLYNEIQGKAVAKKPLQLCGEAYKKKIIDRQQNKQLISWIELCNSVAGNPGEPAAEGQVKQMLSGTQSFLAQSTL
ncbi:hypothetical protein [Desulforhopalus singaporensis]|uniref:Uncharacterized protein n=1 Tax=Desulforhopalus singaporensis TaxID=91360 RepID=A0A1H0LZN5_9BACT|nr:hypothetical protein [Desulforhopalus singaporensis]SDO73501.1 hypothetical protein SAMN05660330_00916 [Desulforhopalus singaporensis]